MVGWIFANLRGQYVKIKIWSKNNKRADDRTSFKFIHSRHATLSNLLLLQVCRPKLLADQSGNWLAELTKLDYFPGYKPIEIKMLCQKIVATQGNKRQVYRSCQLDGGSTNPCDIYKDKAPGDSIKIEHCSICQEDLCNAASSLVSPLVLTTLMVFLAITTTTFTLL